MTLRCLDQHGVMHLIRSLLGLESKPLLDTDTNTAPSPLPAETSGRSRLTVGWATDVGEVRSHNEDTVLVVTAGQGGDDLAPEFGLIVLADGMGGHRAGEVASSLAVRVVAAHVMSQFYLPTLVSDERSTGQPAMNEVLVEALRAANGAVTDQVPGGGTTLTCALMLDQRVYVAHVGDSRAYVGVEETLDQVTQDHSVVDRLVELGQLGRDEAALHPQKNVLYRAIGQRGVLEVDTYVRTIPPEGYLLVCSDGLWGVVDEAEMASVPTTSPSLQAACEALVSAANRAGGRDNISVVLARPPVR